MAKEKVVVSVKAPEVPVMVTGVVPGAAELLTARVRLLVPVVGFWLHDAVTPLGSTDVTARVTLPVNPPASVTVIVDVPVPPWVIASTPDDAAIQKPFT